MIHQRYFRVICISLLSIIPLSTGILLPIFLINDSETVITLIISWAVTAASIIIITLYSVFCYFSTKKYDPGFRSLDYSTLDRFIVKTDVWFFKRLLIFDTDGKYVGMTKIDINGIKSFFLSHLSYYNIIVPLLYRIYDHEGNVICMFKRAGFKSAVVNIFDADGESIGRVEFDEFKTLIKFSGHAFTENGTYQISSEIFFEDAESSLMKLSSFKNRVEYHYIFRDMNNETAELKSPISETEGKVGLAVLALLYYFRW